MISIYHIVSTKYTPTSFTKLAYNKLHCIRQFSQMQDCSHFWMTWINFIKQAVKLQVNNMCWGNNLHLKYQRIMSKETLAYCYLEATGLKNSGRLRITELSFVALNTESILDLNAMLLSHLQNSKFKLKECFPELWIKWQCVCILWPLLDLKFLGSQG